MRHYVVWLFFLVCYVTLGFASSEQDWPELSNEESSAEISSTSLLETTEEFFRQGAMGSPRFSSHKELVHACGVELHHFTPSRSILEALGDVDDSIAILKVLTTVEQPHDSFPDTIIIAKGTLEKIFQQSYYKNMEQSATNNPNVDSAIEEVMFQTKIKESITLLKELIETAEKKLESLKLAQ